MFDNISAYDPSAALDPQVAPSIHGGQGYSVPQAQENQKKWTIPVVSPQKSIWETTGGGYIWLAKEIAQSRSNKHHLGEMYNAAKSGIDPEEWDRNRLAQRLQSELQRLTAQFVEETKDLDDSDYQLASAEFQESLGVPLPQRQVAELQAPNALQSGFALLAAALDPQNAAQSVAQPFMYQLQDQQRQQSLLDQGYSDEIRARNEGIDIATARLGLEERRLGREQSSQDRRANMTRLQIADIQDALTKLDQSERKAIDTAMDDFRLAKTPTSKRQSGERLRQLALSSNDPIIRKSAITQEEIEEDIRFINQANESASVKEWTTAVGAELNQFGLIDDSRVPYFEALAQSLQDRTGVDPRRLMPIPTSRTLKAQSQELANQKFGFLKTKSAEDFRLKWAQYEESKRKTDIAAANADRNYQLAVQRGDIASANLAIRQQEFLLKQRLAETKAVVSPTRAQAQSLIDKLKQESDPKEAAKIRADLNLLIQNAATDLGMSFGDIGMSPQQVMLDPLKAFDKLLEAIKDREEEGAQQKWNQGVDPSSINISLPPAGNEPRATKEERNRPSVLKGNISPKTKPKSSGAKLPDGFGSPK